MTTIAYSESPPATSIAALAPVWIDRDLSWMEFNRRVLAEALDERTPLLERVKFLAIFTSNLDEFFMKRMAVLRESVARDRVTLVNEIREQLLPMLRQQAECFENHLLPALNREGIHLRYWEELTDAQREEAGRFFDTDVSPALTPLVLDSAQPFPFFSNLSTSVAFRLYDAREREFVYARVKVPQVLKQWIRLQTDAPAGELTFVRLHEVILENAHKLYRCMELSGTTLFRLTRDAEVEVDDDDDQSVLEMVREQIRQRRFEPAVRLEFAPGADPDLRRDLQERFKLTASDVYDVAGELDYTTLFEIASLDIPKLRDKPWTPLAPSALQDEDVSIFSTIQTSDLLVHHPYDSFEATVERFIRTAAEDPQTVAIKMTVYRVGDDTPFVRSLIKAAESGKQVACVVELKARFDEARNLQWAAELEKVGAHVTFGVTGLKTHAKTALVVRKEGSGLRCYAHIGTGNYHVRTAKLYTDVGLFTCDPALTIDIVQLFHYLTGRSECPEFTTVVVSPTAMRRRFLELVNREIEHQRAGRPARIIAKMNQLEDPSMIEALCEASRAGVSVDLIVRGLCCLRPGVPGWSEGIRIRSIIGRFLEHSRIFHFAAGAEDPRAGEFYIGSADWMFRNLSRRFEVVVPVVARGAKETLWEILDVGLNDHRQTWMLDTQGRYTQLNPAENATELQARGTHAALMERTLQRLSQLA